MASGFHRVDAIQTTAFGFPSRREEIGHSRNAMPEQQPQTSFRLLVWSDGSVRSIPLRGERWVIGRSLGCDIVLRDAAVSRRHVLLERQGNDFAFRDLGSSNTPMLGGKSARQGKLAAGQTLTVGSTRLVIEPRSTPPAFVPSAATPTVIAREIADEDPAILHGGSPTTTASRMLQRMEWTFADLGDASHAAEPMLDLALNLTGRRRGWFGRLSADGRAETLAELDLTERRRALELPRQLLDDARRLGRPHLVKVRTATSEDELLMVPLGAGGDALLALTAAVADAPPTQEVLRLAHSLAAVAWHRLCEAQERLRLREELQQLRFTVTAAHAALLGSTRLQPIRVALRSMASDGGPLLIAGEPGCEFEELARYLHAESTRRAGPFLAWDAAATPIGQHERELLGVDGVARRAAAGTLFLDNADRLGTANLDALRQATKQADDLTAATTLVAASSLPPGELLATPLGGWLAHRRVDVPPLRQQPGDVLLLAELFLTELGPGPNGAPRTLTERVKRLLATYGWPGNVRELRHVIEAAAAQAADQPIAPRHLPKTITGEAGTPSEVPTLEEMERAHIVDVLQRTGGNRSKSAHLLGIAVSTLYEKLRRYRIAD